MPTYLGWLNDHEVQRFHGTRYPRNMDDLDGRVSVAPMRYSSAGFAVEALDDGSLIGEVTLEALHPEMRSALLGITIGDRSRWGRGYGTDTVRTVCRFGFDMMNLHRVELHVFHENAAAIRAYEKAGFKREGLLREAVYKHGHWMDDVVMGLLQDELRWE